MRKLILLVVTAAMLLPCLPARSQDVPEKKLTVREVFVPSGEMASLLENCKDRILLSRDEFESLLLESLQQEKPEPEPGAPVAAVLLSSDLAIAIEGEQAKIKAVLEWESYTDKLHAKPLAFRSVAIQSAMLNGQPAQLGFAKSADLTESQTPQNDDLKQYTLFWQGKGRQRLELELTTSLTIDSVRQEIAFDIPRAPKATETLVVPGDVELKSGAMIVSRKVEGEGPDRVTRFELLVNDTSQHLVLTLNSHRTRLIRSVLAKSVQFAEVTEHYEKLHATVSLDVLHQPVSAIEFVIPENFEMTDVTSPQLARWGVVQREGRSILDVRFREPVSGQVPLNLTAVHFFETDTAVDTLSEWAFPMFVPLEVSANSAVFGLLVDTGWNVHKIDATRLIALAPQILRGTIPESVFEASVDAPSVRTVAAWYAPNAEAGSVVCEFLKPKPVFDVVSHQVLTLNDREQTMRGLFQVAPRYEKLFELKFEVPEHWTVTRVKNESDVPLPFEQKADRVRVKVTSGIAPGTIFPIFFEASGNTSGWFDAWTEQRLAFPRFCLADAAADSGTIAVDVDDDMIVTPENDARLVPLDNRERTEFLAGLPTDLAFRYLSQPYATDLVVRRATPRLTARTFAFYRFAPSLMAVGYELHYTVEQARTKSLAFLLPTDTPENIGITALKGAAIKDYAASIVTIDDKEYRKWDVQLADPAAGLIVLGVRFEQATPDEGTQSPPPVTADNVAWQSGLVSVEGHEELNLALVKAETARQVDVGELAATQYIPGRRLLGVYEGVNDRDALKVEVRRNPDFQLPASLVQLALGEVEIAADGKRITRAVYDLKTRATFLKIDLAADEEIWAVSLDGTTVKPQKTGSAVLVDIPARDDAAIRELEIIWATRADSRAAKLFSSSDIRLPDLMIPQNVDNSSRDNNSRNEAKRNDGINDGKKEPEQTAEKTAPVLWKKIPVTRVAWNVTAPPGCEVTHIGRQRVEAETPRPLVLRYLHGMFASSGEPRERRPWGFGCSAPAARVKSAATSSADSVQDLLPAQSVPSPSYLSDDVEFDGANKPMSGFSSFDSADSSLEENLEENREALARKKSDAEGAVIGSRFRLERDAAKRSSRYQALMDQEETSIPQTTHGKTGQLSGSVGISSESGRVGRFSLESAVPYQKRTLQTVRPVQVQFQQNLSSPLQRHAQFQLVGGSETQLKVCMINTRLVTFGVYLVWGGVLCAGLCLLRSTLRVRAIYVLAVMGLGTLLVLVPRLEMFAGLFDEAVKAGFWVFVIYLIVGGYRMRKQRRAKTVAASAASTASIAALVLLASALCAGPTRADNVGERPISLPDDAIVAFYDAETLLVTPLLKDGLPDPKMLSQPGQKMLVPYAKYVELWNLVHPGEKVEPVEKPPVDYVTTFGEYRATLAATDELAVTGKAEIEVLADGPVLFPLPIGQGILTAMNVDGKNAEVSISPPTHSPQENQTQQLAQPQPDPQSAFLQQQAMPQPVSDGVFVVQIHGKGKHSIDFTAKFKVERQGGWRLAAGRLPEFPAGKTQLELPEDRMELRCNDVYAQQKWQAESAGQTVETSLGQGGQFRWSWRSKVTEAEVDQSLTAESELRFNLQEDALVLDWDLTLAFRRGKHESFRLRIPADYLVVSIGGENVRGWENADPDSPDEALIDVELLHQTEATERFHIVLMRKADFTDATDVAVSTPNVGVIGAAMHHGRVTLQNSPRLEIRTGEISNAGMTDLPDTGNVVPTSRKTLPDNPLGLKPYRAYRFTAENYRLPLTVNVARQKSDHRLDNIVRLSMHEIKLESNCQLNLSNKSEDRFSERLILPVGLHLDAVQSELPIEWSLKPLESGETELTVIWSVIPQNRRVVFNVLGTIMREPEGEAVLPVIVVQTADPVRQYFVIQTDPAFDVAVEATVHCSMMQVATPDWITASQRPLCRRQLDAFTTSGKDDKPSAKLSLIAREPVISSESITNVQVNSRSVEEMILLDFNIQNAGIRTVKFELPKSMADARIDAPLLQRKEIAENENGETITVTLHLQDEIMNEFRVLIRNNRELMSGKSYPVTIPKISIGTVLNQFVVLENAGSLDELQVDAAKLAGMQKISRQHKEWANLAAILGGNATEAWLVAEKSAPKLSFQMKRRETVKMSGARIGLAETRVVLGENGNYLAEQIYRIDNKTEQFLDLRLPAGAELWAVRLLTNREWEAKQSGAAGDFGQPVKPTTLPRIPKPGDDVVPGAAEPNGVRIPIIKTEVGDLDYIVRVVYVGKCKPIRWAGKLDIPFIEVLNIPVGASYARLHLPEDYKFRFDGTMRESDQAAVSKITSEYDQKINADLQRVAQTGSPFEQARAINNLSLKGIMPKSSGYTIDKQVYETTTQPVPYQAATPVHDLRDRSYHLDASNLSNSMQLEQRFESQSNTRGKNVVLQSESNWKVEESSKVAGKAPQTRTPADASGQQFNNDWFSSNQLENPQSGKSGAKDFSQAKAILRMPELQRRAETIDVDKKEQEAQMFSFSMGLVRSGDDAERSSRVSDAIPAQQAQSQSLKDQERLSDRKLASKLSNTLKSDPFGEPGINAPQSTPATASLPMPQTQMMQQMTQSNMGQPQAPPQVDNLALYQNRLAQQNAAPANSPLITLGMSSAASSDSNRDAAPREEPAGQPASTYGVRGAMGSTSREERQMEEADMRVASGSFGGGGMSGMYGGPGGGSMGGASGMSSSGQIPAVELSAAPVPASPVAGMPFTSQPTEMTATMAVKYTSLDIEIPQTGAVYFFTAPQAENRLSVSGMTTAASQRMKDLGYTAGLAAVCVLVGFLVVRSKKRSQKPGRVKSYHASARSLKTRALRGGKFVNLFPGVAVWRPHPRLTECNAERLIFVQY